MPSNIHATIQHELLHAVGLNDVLSSSGTPLYTGVEDTNKYTIMSYNPHQEENRFVTELQIYDIAALQAIYGRDDGYNSGDTTISQFTETSGPHSGQDRIFSIWDGGGEDTIDASGVAQAALIDLRPGHFSSVGPQSDVQITAGSTPAVTTAGTLNISIAFGTYIENAKGTGAGDLLIGNLLSNKLEGGDGDDVIYGDGVASIHEAGEVDAYYKRVSNTSADKTADALSTIKAFVDDKTKQEDILIGGEGDDYLHGGSGSDTIWGGDEDDDQGMSDGNDIVDYSSRTARITINFNGNGTDTSITVDAGANETDELHSIEHIVATDYNDYLNLSGEIPASYAPGGHSFPADRPGGRHGRDRKCIGGIEQNRRGHRHGRHRHGAQSRHRWRHQSSQCQDPDHRFRL